MSAPSPRPSVSPKPETLMIGPHAKARLRSARLLAALLLLAGFPTTTRALTQRLKFDHLSLREGLSQVTVNAMLQDSRGFMWFGTQDGLNRYDGYNVVVYKHDPSDPRSLSHNLMVGLYEDREGGIWVVPNQLGVLNRFDPLTGLFQRFLNDPEDPATLAASLINPRAICECSNGELWLGTFGGGINRLDRTTGSVRRVTQYQGDPASLGHNVVSVIHKDRAGRVWVGTAGSGLHRWIPASGDESADRFERYVHRPDEPDSLSHDVVSAIYEDSSGGLWIGTQGGGLNRFEPESGKFKRYAWEEGLAGNFIPGFRSPIVEDSSGRIWVITNTGLSRLDPSTGAIQNYRADSTDLTSLSSNAVSALHVDGTGQLWVATMGGGLNRYDAEEEAFEVSVNDPTEPRSLSSNFLVDFYEDRSGILWIGTQSAGATRYSRQQHKFRHYERDPSDPESLTDEMVFALQTDRSGALWVGTMGGGLHRLDEDRQRVTQRYFLRSGDRRNLGTNFVRAILADSADRLWVGTAGAGLARIDVGGYRVVERYINQPNDPTSLSNNVIQSIFEDSRGELWIGTAFGWNRFDPIAGVFRSYFNDPQDPTSLANSFARCTYEDSSGRLWVGTTGGLSRFDRDSETFVSYFNQINDPESLSHNNIMAIHENDEGALWLATYGGGLDRLDPQTETFTHFTTKDGLPNDAVYSVLPDFEGNFWLATNYGLSKFDPRNKTFTNYDVNDGLQSNEFNGRAFFKTAGGEMLFGGINGFNSFYPEEIKASQFRPPIVLTAFRKFGQIADLGVAVDAVDRIQLSYREDFFSFEFATLDYSSPSRNEYAYMLEGFDRDWVYSGNRHYAPYTNLDGGSYTFRVKGSNGDGVWNEEGLSVKVLIAPPPWKTWWAYTLYLLLAGSGLFGYLRYKTLHYEEELQRHRDALERERLLTIERENQRRAAELEQARAIQISLLPTEAPRLAHLEIAVSMKTATEVGGDYYDFFPLADGSLYIVTGDATGHGMSAGMMVAMTKAALKAVEVKPPHELLRQLNNVIRAVNLERMQMALNAVHITEQQIAMSSAGMPPPLLYRDASGEVEEFLVEGLPLGGLEESAYDLRTVEPRSGDALVLISDGLPEKRDANGSMLGYEAVQECVARIGARPAQEIVDALLQLGEQWSPDGNLEDDITVMVFKWPPSH